MHTDGEIAGIQKMIQTGTERLDEITKKLEKAWAERLARLADLNAAWEQVHGNLTTDNESRRLWESHIGKDGPRLHEFPVEQRNFDNAVARHQALRLQCDTEAKYVSDLKKHLQQQNN